MGKDKTFSEASVSPLDGVNGTSCLTTAVGYEGDIEASVKPSAVAVVANTKKGKRKGKRKGPSPVSSIRIIGSEVMSDSSLLFPLSPISVIPSTIVSPCHNRNRSNSGISNNINNNNNNNNNKFTSSKRRQSVPATWVFTSASSTNKSPQSPSKSASQLYSSYYFPITPVDEEGELSHDDLLNNQPSKNHNQRSHQTIHFPVRPLPRSETIQGVAIQDLFNNCNKKNSIAVSGGKSIRKRSSSCSGHNHKSSNYHHVALAEEESEDCENEKSSSNSCINSSSSSISSSCSSSKSSCSCSCSSVDGAGTGNSKRQRRCAGCMVKFSSFVKKIKRFFGKMIFFSSKSCRRRSVNDGSFDGKADSSTCSHPHPHPQIISVNNNNTGNDSKTNTTISTNEVEQ